MNPLANTFGIEIECYIPNGTTPHQMAAAVAAKLGTPCRVEGYNHTTRGHWKVVPDGSLGDYTHGWELVSPILKGEAGFAALEKACAALSEFGCTVRQSCGVHVHVGVGNVPSTVGFFRDLLKVYGIYEPVIDTLMPVSRRANNSIWCGSVAMISPSRLDSAVSFEDLLRLLGRTPDDQRRRKVNLHAYRRHRTVEFRQHGGTLDYTKIRNWAMLCMRLVERVKAGGLFTGPGAAPGALQLNQARMGSKSWHVGQMLLRPQGVTRTEAMEVTGWPSISLPQQAAACGLTVTTERMGRVVRYFARAAADAAPAIIGHAASLASLFETLNCDAGEREFFAHRATVLAS